jgi:hypothetical protein
VKYICSTGTIASAKMQSRLCTKSADLQPIISRTINDQYLRSRAEGRTSSLSSKTFMPPEKGSASEASATLFRVISLILEISAKIHDDEEEGNYYGSSQ